MISFGFSFGNTVPLWKSKLSCYGWWRSRFYVFANRTNAHGKGYVGFKAWIVFVRVSFGRRV